jgi:hypothetical protein
MHAVGAGLISQVRATEVGVCAIATCTHSAANGLLAHSVDDRLWSVDAKYVFHMHAFTCVGSTACDEGAEVLASDARLV